MIGKFARRTGVGGLSLVLTAIVLVAMTALTGIVVRTTLAKASLLASATGPAPRFGFQSLLSSNYGLITNLGGGLYEVVGNSVTWSILQPDGRTFNTTVLNQLDQNVRLAFQGGMRDLELRISTGGASGQKFSGDPSTWPVDTTNYSNSPYNGYKNGEFIGGPTLSPAYALPPLDLTDNGLFYQFVYALATRYNGNTADPNNAGKNFANVRVWSIIEEPDTKTYFYGTATDYYGGVGGDPEVGIVPTFARAVKAANPTAIVIAPGLTSHNLGLSLAHALAESRGNVYDAVVRDYGRTYFNTWYDMAHLFDSSLPDNLLYQQFENDNERARARLFVDRSLDPEFAEHVDAIAVHMYDNYLMLKDVIDLYKGNLPGKEIWGTEMGFSDNPQDGMATAVPDNDHAVWLFKKIVIGLAEGMNHFAYVPMFKMAGVTDGFTELFPTTTSWKPARMTMHMLGNVLNEVNGFSYVNQVVQGGTTFYLFNSSDGLTHAAAAWNDSGSDTIDVKSLLGIPAGARTFVFGKLETPVAGADLTQLPVSVEPYLILWTTANIDADSDGYPKYIDCNDRDATVNPGKTEANGNSKDDDCNPLTPTTGCLSVLPTDLNSTTTARAANIGILLLPVGIAAVWRAVRRPARRSAS